VLPKTGRERTHLSSRKEYSALSLCNMASKPSYRVAARRGMQSELYARPTSEEH
jgi:hypothetical protein